MNDPTNEAMPPAHASPDPPPGLAIGADGRTRCWWCGDDPEYERYHDHEWGFPVADDIRLFEKLVLEGFQSGLSWLTILRKRENFRAAFDGFDFERVARYGEAEVARLLDDAGIVRHRGKIEATINNARRASEIVDEHGSLAAFLWRYEPAPEERPARMDHATLMSLAQTEASRRLAKDLKTRGWRFFGPTTAYAFMQAMGLVNDHLAGCDVRAEVSAARAGFARPE
jgi:DNA-3-methyladenine glycosylase I